jgi:hypothetical protein
VAAAVEAVPDLDGDWPLGVIQTSAWHNYNTRDAKVRVMGSGC